MQIFKHLSHFPSIKQSLQDLLEPVNSNNSRIIVIKVLIFDLRKLANFQIFGKILKQNLHFLRNDKNILLNSHKIHWSLTLPYPWAIVSVLKCFKPLVMPFMLVLCLDPDHDALCMEDKLWFEYTLGTVIMYAAVGTSSTWPTNQVHHCGVMWSHQGGV